MRDYDCLDDFEPLHTHSCPECKTLWHGWNCQTGNCDLAADASATCPTCVNEADLATLIEADIRANETPDDYLTPLPKKPVLKDQLTPHYEDWEHDEDYLNPKLRKDIE